MLLALLALLSGCVGSGTHPIERTLGGERRSGVFVSPHSYEHFVRGELARLAGSDAAARDAYELARAGAADDPLLCARLAETLERLGDSRGADRALADGLALDAAAEVVHLARGAILEARGDLDGALAAYRAAHEAAPESVAPILAVVRLTDSTGARSRAEALLRDLAADGAASSARGALLARVAATADAVELLELTRTLGVAEPRLYSTGARRALWLGHPGLALRLIARLAPRAEERGLRIEIALAARDTASARALLATPPVEFDVAVLVSDARAYLLLGEPADAEAHARAALVFGPSPAASLALGLALEARGALEEAAAVLSAIPPATRAAGEARAALARVFSAAGMPALADEFDD